MQNEILDAPEAKPTLKYQQWSYRIALLVLSILVIFILLAIKGFEETITTAGAKNIFFPTVLVSPLISLIGMVLGLLSYKRGEVRTYRRTIGLVGNGLFLAIIGTFVIVVIIMALNQ